MKQITEKSELMNEYLDVINECLKIIIIRMKYELSNEDFKDFNDFNLLNVLIDLFQIVFWISSHEIQCNSFFSIINPVEKSKVFFLQENLLLIFSYWVEFSDYLEIIFSNFYVRIFKDLNQRPGILILMKTVLKICSDSPKKEKILKIFKNSINENLDELFKGGYACTALINNNSIFENIIKNFIYSESLLIRNILSGFCDSILRLISLIFN